MLTKRISQFLIKHNSILQNSIRGNKNRRLKVFERTEKKGSIDLAHDLRGQRDRKEWETLMEKEKLLKNVVPTDDVYFMSKYRIEQHSFTDAIENLKDLCLDETLFNFPNSLIEAEFVLNMRTNKATKYIMQFIKFINIPYKFKDEEPKLIVAFCASEDTANRLLEEGAFIAGNESIFQQFISGEVNYEQYDVVICEKDMLKRMKKLKLVLRDKFPDIPHINVSDNIEELFKLNRDNIIISTTKKLGIPEEGLLTVPLGTVAAPIKQLEANFMAYINCIIQNKSSQVAGNPIVRINLHCLPCDPIRLDVDDIMSSRVSVQEEAAKQEVKKGTQVAQ